MADPNKQFHDPVLPPPNVDVLEQLKNPFSEGHAFIKNRIQARLNLSYRHIQQRWANWDEIDETLRGFIDLSRKAQFADRTQSTDTAEMPFQRAVTVPLSFAILQTRLTALLAIYGSRQPPIAIAGKGPEDIKSAKIMESTVDYDLNQSRIILTLYSLFQDIEKYGIGIVYDIWDEVKGWKFQHPEDLGKGARMFWKAIGFPVVGRRTYDTISEFNNWKTIDPFYFWPDPRVPVTEVQLMEYIGHRAFRSYSYLVENSQENGGAFFNLAAARSAKGPTIRHRSFSRDTVLGLSAFDLQSTDPGDRGFYVLDNFQIKLIPKEWGLGEQSNPQIWWFTMLNEQFIIRAHPSAYAHGRFTYSVAEPNYDPHSLFNMGNIENMQGLQRLMNWLFNSHIENVRRILNDALIYSPTWIEEADILNPGPARHIRLTDAGEKLVRDGRLTLQQMVFQLQISDVTRTHLQDLEVIYQFVQRMMGTNETQMGVQTRDKRTLGEVERMMFSAGLRMGTTARVLDSLAVLPTVERHLQNRQQFTSLDQFIRIAGELVTETGALQQVQINRQRLQGNYDYMPITGAIPPDPARFAEVWTKILIAIGRFPVLLQPGPDGKALDIRKVFNEAARTSGARNINDMYTQVTQPVQVQEDEEVLKQLQRGNIVPPGELDGDGLQGRLTPGADFTEDILKEAFSGEES